MVDNRAVTFNHQLSDKVFYDRLNSKDEKASMASQVHLNVQSCVEHTVAPEDVVFQFLFRPKNLCMGIAEAFSELSRLSVRASDNKTEKKDSSKSPPFNFPESKKAFVLFSIFFILC